MADKVSNEQRLNGKERQILFQSMDVMLQNLQANMEHLSKVKHFEHTRKFIDLVYDGLIKKRKFFLLASGRSAFILQCFATRLVHLGAEIYIGIISIFFVFMTLLGGKKTKYENLH